MIEQTPVLNMANGKSKAALPVVGTEERQSLPKMASTFSEALKSAGKSVEKASSEGKVPFSEIQVEVTTVQTDERAVNSGSGKFLPIDSDSKIDLEAVLQQINRHSDAEPDTKNKREGVQSTLHSDSSVEVTLKNWSEKDGVATDVRKESDSHLALALKDEEEFVHKDTDQKDIQPEKGSTDKTDQIEEVHSMVANAKVDKADSVEEVKRAVLIDKADADAKDANVKTRTPEEDDSSLAKMKEKTEQADPKEKLLAQSVVESKKTQSEASVVAPSVTIEADKDTQPVAALNAENDEQKVSTEDVSKTSSQPRSQNKHAEVSGNSPVQPFDKTAEQVHDKRAAVADDKLRTSVHKDSNIPTNNEPKHSKTDSSNQVGNGSTSNSNSQGSSNQGQSSQQNPQGQQFSQQQQQMLNQLQKQQVSKEHQEVLKNFNDALSTEAQKTEKTEKVIGNLGVGFDSRNQLPAGLQVISQGVRTPQWGHALGHRVTYMANNKIQEAKITLNPEKLGSIQVKLNIDKDQQVHVSMTAQHGTTREAIENAMPRLKEMLEAAGVGFGSLDVKDERAFSENDNEDHQKQQGFRGEASSEVGSDLQDEPVVVQSSNNNIVDYYA